MNLLQHYLDKEQYFERYSNLDKVSRECGKGCREAFEASCRSSNAVERAALHIACRQALSKIPHPDSKLALIISHQLDNAIVFEKGEYNFPTTHGNIMFFPRTFLRQSATNQMAKTILHEAIHIYQRYYPLEANILLQKVWGFKMVGLRPGNVNHDWRSNPDTNNIVYADNNGRIITSYMNPHDFKLLDPRDHPYEIMAYKLADYIYDASATGPTRDWINKYLYGR